MKQIRKRLFSMLLSSTLILGMMPVTAQAVSLGVEINETNFPDENFRQYVSDKLDNNSKDGYLSTDEIANVTEINFWEKSIETLKGIEYFTNLKTLKCCYNGYEPDPEVKKLTTLDVSKNLALEELECSDAALESLDVSKNTALTYLSCGGNQLTSLDVSQNTKLEYLGCAGNQLKTLDLSNNEELINLYCGNNQIEELVLEKNVDLINLDCSNNKLKTLDVGNNLALESLYCSNNQLNVLDLSKNTSLCDIGCGENQLTSLDISQATGCYGLYASDNSYSIIVDEDRSFDLTKLPEGFNVAKASKWTGGTVSGNILTIANDTDEVTYDYDCGWEEAITFKLKAHIHSYVADWIYDEDGHWKECECGVIGKAADHTFGEWTETKAATLTEKGQKERICSVCGYKETEEIPALTSDPTPAPTPTPDPTPTPTPTPDPTPGNIDNGNIANDTKPSDNAFSTNLSETPSELKDKVLTDAERARVANGETASIYLEVTDVSASVSDTDKNLVEAAKGETTIGMYIDISLFAKVGSDEPHKVANTNGTVTITVQVPETLINTNGAVARNYQIIRVHDGVSSVIPCTYDAATKTISFETDAFSTYALAYKDTVNNTTTPSATTPSATASSATASGATTIQSSAPKTGDNTNAAGWILLVALSGIGVVFSSRRVVVNKKK